MEMSAANLFELPLNLILLVVEGVKVTALIENRASISVVNADLCARL